MRLAALPVLAAALTVLALPGCIQITVGPTEPSSPAADPELAAPAAEESEAFAVDFHWTPENPRVNQTVQFQATVTGLGDRTVSDWVWEWGDGKTGSGTRASHAWKQPSIDGYDVTLRVLTSQGEVVERTHNVLVLGTR